MHTLIYLHPQQFQSSLPRRERLVCNSRCPFKICISILAPAKGATFRHYSICKAFIYFNPRSREGSDRLVAHLKIIHPNFNPRSREGSDAVKSISAIDVLIFQSSLPRRERLIALVYNISTPKISILAPAKGATSLRKRNRNAFSISILAPAKGATSPACQNHIPAVISILAPAKGATKITPTPIFFKSFQSSLPRRERQTAADSPCSHRIYFNPRSREGSDIPSMQSSVYPSSISILAPAKGATGREGDTLL